jgi:hypothetical protein
VATPNFVLSSSIDNCPKSGKSALQSFPKVYKTSALILPPGLFLRTETTTSHGGKMIISIRTDQNYGFWPDFVVS